MTSPQPPQPPARQLIADMRREDVARVVRKVVEPQSQTSILDVAAFNSSI